MLAADRPPPLGFSSLHHAVIAHLIAHGHAPTIDALAARFAAPRDDIVAQLKGLQDYRGVALNPSTAEVWACHPFANAPTGYCVECGRGRYWGMCAWCSLGVAKLLAEAVTITCNLGGETEQVRIVVDAEGRIAQAQAHLLVHFPLPLRRAWENVMYFCSTIHVFTSLDDVDRWCARHGMPRGDVQPIQNVSDFARAWYGNHLREDWVKWTPDEIKALFARFNLGGDTWSLTPSSAAASATTNARG